MSPDLAVSCEVRGAKTPGAAAYGPLDPAGLLQILKGNHGLSEANRTIMPRTSRGGCLEASRIQVVRQSLRQVPLAPVAAG
jgi:hypothetical protein